MKKYTFLYLMFICLFACETIEGPYMIDHTTTPIDTTNNYIKKVLIEEFTAHKCANCPKAAKILTEIHNLYPEQIIGLAIHAKNSFSEPNGSGLNPDGFDYDFRTEYGSDIYENIMESCPIPQGMVNRIGYPDGNHKLLRTEWIDVVESERIKEVNIGLQVNSTINGNTGDVNILIDVINDIEGEYNLAVCLTESNIINWQIDGEIETNSYEHNHVLRSMVSNEALSSKTNYIAGEKINKSIYIDLLALQQANITYSNNIEEGNGNAGGWEPNNMSIIVYVYHINTYEVIQAEEVQLIN